MPCPCGSGLRAARCCAVPAAAFLPESAERPLAPLLRQAREATESAVAAALCVEILELSPGHREALWLLATLRRGQPAAEALLRRLVGLEPNHLAATQALALALIERGAVQQAEPLARDAIRLAPQNPQAHSLLARVLAETGDPRAGEAHDRRALALLRSRDPMLLANLARSLALQGRLAEARALYQESAQAAPGVARVWLECARLELADGRLEAASACLDHAGALAPGDANVRLLRADLQDRAGDPAAALATLELLPAETLGGEAWLRKGRLLDRLGQYDAAFAAFSAGKARLLAASGAGYDEAAAVALVDRLRGFFGRRRLGSLKPAPRRGEAPLPLFILGFPRSGAGLLELMLGGHGSISAGGALPLLGDLAALAPRLLMTPLGYPEALSELWMADRAEGLEDLRALYLRRLARAAGSAGAYVTDRMPANEMHLGLIELLLADAPMVRMQRHPFDAVLSVFATQTAHGYRCGFDLTSAARHYALMAQLQAHYAAELERTPVTVRYENLVAAPERELRRVLDAAGLAWEPECLHAESATHAIHPHAVGRWRHYRRQLEQVLPILAPVAERLGYAVD